MNSQNQPTPSTNTSTTDTTLANSSNTTTPENEFLSNLSQTYHVHNIPLAIFLLILSCIFAILLALLLVYCVRLILRRYFVGQVKSRRKKPRPIYADEIPGLKIDQHGSESPAWLQYSIEYRLKQQVLVIGIIQSNNLVSQSESVPAKFYVTLSCEHVDQTTGYTKIRDKSVRTKPADLSAGICSWNELFPFEISEKEISNLRLSIRIYELFSSGRDHDHGQLYVTLRDENMSEYVGHVLEKTGIFVNATGVESRHGELCIGMAYYPREEKLDVHVLEAAQLELPKKPRPNEQGHIYIMVSLKAKKQVLKRFETDKRKELECPYFNQKFTFKLKNEHLPDAYIYCAIKYSGGWGVKQHVGYVWIGSNSMQNSGIKQWEETIKHPSKVHILWHPVAKSE